MLFQRELRTTQGDWQYPSVRGLKWKSMLELKSYWMSNVNLIEAIPSHLWGTASIWIKGQLNEEQLIGKKNGPSFKINCGKIKVLFTFKWSHKCYNQKHFKITLFNISNGTFEEVVVVVVVDAVVVGVVVVLVVVVNIVVVDRVVVGVVGVVVADVVFVV